MRTVTLTDSPMNSLMQLYHSFLKYKNKNKEKKTKRTRFTRENGGGFNTSDELSIKITKEGKN
jgi:hypothetical protein